MSITITLPYPISVNRIWRVGKSGKIYLTSEATDYKTEVGWLCRAQHMEPLLGMIAIEINIYRPRKTGDADNISKLVLDSLQGHAYHDDKQVIDLHLRRFDDKDNPRLDVTIGAIE